MAAVGVVRAQGRQLSLAVDLLAAPADHADPGNKEPENHRLGAVTAGDDGRLPGSGLQNWAQVNNSVILPSGFPAKRHGTRLQCQSVAMPLAPGSIVSLRLFATRKRRTVC